MSGFETLPPDQRAVLQLILAQGRGYAELAQLLKLDPSAVRMRAHAGLDALATSGSTPDAAQRGQIADYLLGQQDDGERFVTLVALGESAVASEWARTLRAQLAPLAHEPLPEVPETVSPNGAAGIVAAPVAPATAISPPVAAAPAPTAAPPAPAPPASLAVASPPPAAAAANPSSPPAPPQTPSSPATTTPGARPSRLGGAILLAAAAALVAVLAIVLIGGNGDDNGAKNSVANTTSTPAPARTSTQASTTGSQATGQIIAQVNLLATPAGGQATGLGFVQRAQGKLAIAIQAQKLPANSAQDIYAAWLSGPAGTKLLGFVPHQVKANGNFTVSAELPANAAQYDSVLISRESAAGGAVPTQPGATIMRGTLKLS